MLTETSHPIKTVAKEVGYYNVSSFIRRFKEHQGITPGVYRETIISADIQ